MAAAPVSPVPTSPILDVVQSSLDNDKAIEPVLIDLAGKTEIADWMLVVTGTSQRHLASMAENVLLRLKDAGYPGMTAEGTSDSQTSWVVIDAGDVIVHLFRAETRVLYDIEKLWSLLPPARSGETGVVVKAARSKPPAKQTAAKKTGAKTAGAKPAGAKSSPAKPATARPAPARRTTPRARTAKTA